MWRMFRAAILGVVIGVIGGAIFGHMSYIKNYKNRLDRTIRSNAVMYNNGQEDDNSVIRIKVDYDGDDQTDGEGLESHVGNTILDAVAAWLGDDYSSRYSYVEMRHRLNMVMDKIDDIAKMAALEEGVEVDSDSRLSYEYFDDYGADCPAGFYHTLDVDLVDKN